MFDMAPDDWIRGGVTVQQAALIWSTLTGTVKSVSDFSTAATALGISASTVNTLSVYATEDVRRTIFAGRDAARSGVSWNSAPVGPPSEVVTKR